MNNESKEWWEVRLEDMCEQSGFLDERVPPQTIPALKATVAYFVSETERRTWNEAKALIENKSFDVKTRDPETEYGRGNNDACIILLSKIDAKLKRL